MLNKQNGQIRGWGWISFHLKEENAWDIILLA